ncbi:MAG: MFS transporter [Planctomycetes bacterium]|nr:MFS transporter [Planctomycetota bacterium]
MPLDDLSRTLTSPAAHVAIGLLGALLLGTLARELPKVPRPLLVLMAAAFVDMFGVFLVVPLLPFYCKRLGAGFELFGTPLEAGVVTGLVMATFTVFQLASAPFWGRFSDRYGRRPAPLVALGASAAAYVVFGFADSLWLLLLSRAVQGAGGGTVGVIQAYVADSVPPEERARALGWLSAATNLGVALGPVLGSFSVVLGEVDLLPGAGTWSMGTAAPGLAAALLCLLNMLFAAKWLPESHGEAGGHAHRTGVLPALGAVFAHPGRAASRLLFVYAIAIGSGQGINAVMAHLLNANFAITEKEIGVVFTFLGAISVFARVLVLGRLVDRFGEARVARIGVVTLGAGLVLLPAAVGLASLALAVALLPLGMALTFPCLSALLSRVVPAAERGMYMGLQQTFGGAMRIVGPLWFGWAFDRLGHPVPFQSACLFVLLTLPLVFGLPRLAAGKGAAKGG